MPGLKLITASAIEPTTLEEVKRGIHVYHNDDDALIESWIRTARQSAETFQRRSHITQTWEYSLDTFPSFPLDIPRAPLSSVTSIKYYDTDDTEYTLDTGDYIVDTSSEPGRINLRYGVTLPTTTLRTLDAVKIRYVSGEGAAETAVSSNIKDAIMLYCAHRNENRSGEIDETPKQFYDLLREDKLYMSI